MYLSRNGLFVLFGGGILLILTLVLIAVGGVSAVQQVWVGVAVAALAIALFWLLLKLIRRADDANVAETSRGYFAQRFSGYWALKLFSAVLKIIAATMLAICILGLFLFTLVRIVGFTTINAAISGDILVPFIAYPVWIIYWGFGFVSTYAFGQLIDLLLSVELSLRTLATRRRPQNDETPPSAG